MKSALIILTIFIFLLVNISASCDKSQIDINSASVEELTGIDYIGPVKAQEIINSRPFESIDDLIEVKGIGNWTLDKIKNQGLACVNGQGEEEPVEEAEEDKETTKEENVVEEHQEIEELPEIEEISSREIEPIELQTINLNPALHG